MTFSLSRYLYIKGLHDREVVLDARLAVLEYVDSTGKGKLHPDFPLEHGVLDKRCGRGCVPFMEVCLKTKSDILFAPLA